MYKSTISDSNWEVPKHFKWDTERKLDPWIFQMWQVLRLPNLLNSNPLWVQINYYQWKRLKKVEENSFRIFNYFSKSSLLISTFTWPVDYRKRENNCKGPLLAYGCTSPGVKHWLFYRKYRIEVVNLKCCKFK